MKSFLVSSGSAVRYGLAVLIALSAFAAMPLLSRAHPPQTASITVVNNSGWVITHLYLSPVSREDWGADQLNDSSLSPGGSFTISNVSCSGSIKVISEDADGCFLSQVVECSENAQWTITTSATPNCGTE